jgi:DNA-binding NtrC family response regulator
MHLCSVDDHGLPATVRKALGACFESLRTVFDRRQGRHKMSSEEVRAKPTERLLVAFIDSSRMTRETFRIYMEDSVSAIRIAPFSSLDDYISSMGVLVFDLIIYSITDASTSNGSGWGELTEIAAKASPIPVLALVDTGGAAAMTRAAECGAAYCLQISNELQPLIEMLERFRAERCSGMTRSLENKSKPWNIKFRLNFVSP